MEKGAEILKMTNGYARIKKLGRLARLTWMDRRLPSLGPENIKGMDNDWHK
jgi:hypothetical protein